MATGDYRAGIELLVPAFAAGAELPAPCIFRISFMLDELSAPPGYVMARGRVQGESQERVLRLPLGLQLASRGVVYGQHAYAPAGDLVRGYVLNFQGPSRFPRTNYPTPS